MKKAKVKKEQDSGKKSMISRLIDKVAEMFLPLVNVLSAAGILKGIIAIFLTLGWLTEADGTYVILNALSDSVFYFLPVFLAATAARTLGANPITAMVIGAVTLYPDLTSRFADGEALNFGIFLIYPVTYRSSIIPIILAVILLVYVERLLKRFLPVLIRDFMLPLLSVLVVGLVTLGIFGPLGALVGDGLSLVYSQVYAWNPMAAGLLLGALIQPMVIFGFHWSFILVAMNNVAVNGFDTILALIAPAVFAQAGAALAVGIRSKDNSFRTTCFSAVISAFFGVTEPAMFGVNLPRKTPFAAVCIGGAAGGMVAGISGAGASSFAFPNIVTLPIFIGEGFALFLISCGVGLVTAFVTTILLDKFGRKHFGHL